MRRWFAKLFHNVGFKIDPPEMFGSTGERIMPSRLYEEKQVRTIRVIGEKGGSGGSGPDGIVYLEIIE